MSCCCSSIAAVQMFSEALIHCDDSVITLDCPAGNVHLSFEAVQNDPLVLVDALAPLSPASLDNAERVQWTLNALKRTVPAILPRLSKSQTASDTRLVSWRIAVQQESMEDELFVPFDARGEFVMFDADQGDAYGDGHYEGSLLVPRRQFYLHVLSEDGGQIVHAYAYESVSLQLNSVHDVVGFLDSDGELHMLYAMQPAVPEAPRSGMFDELVTLFASLFGGQKSAAQMLVFSLLSTTYLKGILILLGRRDRKAFLARSLSATCLSMSSSSLHQMQPY